MTKVSQNVRTDKSKYRHILNVEEITPQIAEKWLTHNLPKNRRKTVTNVEFLVKEITSGNWQVNGETIKFDTDGNLFDGQHRLTAVVRSGISIHSFIARGLTTDAYQTVDSGKSRSLKDRFYTKGTKNSTNIASMVGYIKKIENRYSHTLKSSGKESFSFYDRNEEALQNCLNFVRSAYNQSGYRDLSPALGSAFLFIASKGNDKKAHEFIAKVFTGVNIDSMKCPSSALRRKIKQGKDRVMPMRTKVVFLIKAWNCYVKGKKISNLRMPAKFPKII